MPLWLIYILIATSFGSLSIVLAKIGLREASESVALLVRTSVLFVSAFAISFSRDEIRSIVSLERKTLLILVGAGIATAIYWFLYYRALKLANASLVAAVDKAGLMVTVLLSAALLKEELTIKTVAGIALILTGCIMLAFESKT